MQIPVRSGWAERCAWVDARVPAILVIRIRFPALQQDTGHE